MTQSIELQLRPTLQDDPAEETGGERLFARVAALLHDHVLVALLIGLPTLLATLYYLLIATNIYVSEAQFVVRSAGGTSGLGAISSLVKASSLMRSGDDTFAVNAYMTSRGAIDRLIREEGLLDILSRPEADFLSRFPWPATSATREALFRRFDEFVDVSYDGGTGINTLNVRAFRAEDAQRIAGALLTHAEELINRMNSRAREDAIVFATEAVQSAEAKVNGVQQRLTEFRNREMVFDPARQSLAALELIGKLTGETSQLKATLGELLASSPDSPKVAAIRGRIRALEQQIEEQRQAIAGGDNALAPKLAAYERLNLERELATKSFLSALLSLENARGEAQRQQLYLEHVVEPSLPDLALYPRRLLSILKVFGLSLCVFWIASFLGGAVLEHEP